MSARHRHKRSHSQESHPSRKKRKSSTEEAERQDHKKLDAILASLSDLKSEITSCNEMISDIEARNALLDDDFRPSSFDVSNKGDDDQLSILAGDEFGVHQDASTHRTSHLLAEKPPVAVSRPTEEAI